MTNLDSIFKSRDITLPTKVRLVKAMVFSSGHVWMWRKLSAKELMLLNCGVGEDSWESLGLQGDPIRPFERRSVLGIHWKDWCWSWNSNTLATSCEELTHLKRPWYWERLRAGWEEDDREWDDWMTTPTQWTWVWVASNSWWWTGRPGMLQSMGSQKIGHDWGTKLNWTVSRRLVQAGSPALAPSPSHALPDDVATWSVVARVRDKIWLFLLLSKLLINRELVKYFARWYSCKIRKHVHF